MLYRIGLALIAAANPLEAVERSGLPPAFIEYGLRAVKPMEGPLFARGWASGTTRAHFARLGVHGGINVRAGESWRNDAVPYGASEKIDRRNARRELAELGLYDRVCIRNNDVAGRAKRTA
jgi:hypothetical protein